MICLSYNSDALWDIKIRINLYFCNFLVPLWAVYWPTGMSNRSLSCSNGYNHSRNVKGQQRPSGIFRVNLLSFFSKFHVLNEIIEILSILRNTTGKQLSMCCLRKNSRFQGHLQHKEFFGCSFSTLKTILSKITCMIHWHIVGNMAPPLLTQCSQLAWYRALMWSDIIQ